MKTVEALISCMVLLSFSSIILLQAPYPNSSAIEQYRLADDVWRIAYLKGCFNQSAPLEIELTDAEGVAKDLAAGDASGFAAELKSLPAGDNADSIEKCLQEERVLDEIYLQTGLEASFDVLEATGGEELSTGTAITKTVIIGGVPQKVTLRVG